jgi:hypothetical protein
MATGGRKRAKTGDGAPDSAPAWEPVLPTHAQGVAFLGGLFASAPSGGGSAAAGLRALVGCALHALSLHQRSHRIRLDVADARARWRSAWEAGEALYAPPPSPQPSPPLTCPGAADGAALELPTLDTLRTARGCVVRTTCTERRTRADARASCDGRLPSLLCACVQALAASRVHVGVGALCTRLEQEDELRVEWERDGEVRRCAACRP